MKRPAFWYCNSTSLNTSLGHEWMRPTLVPNCFVVTENKPLHVEKGQKHLPWVNLQHQVMTVIVGKGPSIQKGLVEHSPHLRWVWLTPTQSTRRPTLTGSVPQQPLPQPRGSPFKEKTTILCTNQDQSRRMSKAVHPLSNGKHHPDSGFFQKTLWHSRCMSPNTDIFMQCPPWTLTYSSHTHRGGSA